MRGTPRVEALTSSPQSTHRTESTASAAAAGREEEAEEGGRRCRSSSRRRGSSRKTIRMIRITSRKQTITSTVKKHGILDRLFGFAGGLGLPVGSTRSCTLSFRSRRFAGTGLTSASVVPQRFDTTTDMTTREEAVFYSGGI